MRLLKTLSLLGAAIALLAVAAAAETVGAHCTAPTTVVLPCSGHGAPRVFLRAGSGRWQPQQVQVTEGCLRFELDPAKLGAATVMLLIDPPAGMVIDDYTGPALIALAADRQTVKGGDLGKVSTPPRMLSFTFRDAANALDPQSFRATLDGRNLPLRPTQITRQSDREATLRLRLRELEYGRHELTVTAADASPQGNPTTATLRFNYLESGNVVLAALGAKVTVDSSFSGYESLVCLNDGNTTMPGDSCGNDITWASAETNTDHWAEVTLPRPTPLKEVSLYWAAYTNVAHTARHFELQIPDGNGWKAVYTSPDEGEKEARVTTVRFAPVTTSKFRIFMPNGQGSTTRPNLLWLGEIKAR